MKSYPTMTPTTTKPATDFLQQQLIIVTNSAPETKWQIRGDFYESLLSEIMNSRLSEEAVSNLRNTNG